MSLSAIGGQWQALVRPNFGRASFTAQMVLVCVLITIVAVTYRLPNLAVTVYAAFFLYRAERSATILTAIVMPIFITIVLAIALLSTVLVVDHPFWRVWSMATVSFAVLFLGSASKLKPFAPTLALILGYVLDLIGGLPVGELATRGFLYAWLIAGIPAAACIVVALLVGAAPRRLLEAALAERLRRAAGLLRGEDASAAEALLRQGDAAMCALLKSAQREHALVGAADAALSRAIDSSLAILCFAVLTAKRPVDGSDDLARLRIAAALAEMAAIVEAGSYPVGIDLPPMPGTTELLRREVIAFAEEAAWPQLATSGGFLLPDAFTNPAHVRYALKTTAAAMTCYIVFQLLDWPGIHTCLITCYVVSLGSAAETIEKLTLRICGCLFGAVLGFGTLIFVLPHVDGITALAAIIALGTLPAAWVAAGGPRVAYAGLQIAFAFYLIVLQGPSPAFDLSTGRDRIVGVLFGNLVIYLLFTRVWPVSLSAQVDPAIARVLRALSDLAVAGREGARHRIGGVRNAVAAVRQQLSVACYEPRGILPSNGWFRDRELALAEIDTLQLSVLEHVMQGGESDTAAARALDTLAARIEGGTIPPSETGRHGASRRWIALCRIQTVRSTIMRSDKAIAAALTVALLAGCAERSLDLAPPRPDRPWTAATNTGGEITAGATPAAGGGRSYALPANPALGELPAQPSIDAEHAYDLPELLDIAESSNPLSRIAWDEAKQAALSVGLVRSAYLPRLSATAAGIAQTSHDDQRLDAASVAGNGDGSGAIAAVSLQWLLFDFGQRRALARTAEQLSVIANIHFNATHQKIVRDVSVAFYAASAAREQSADAEHALADALVVQDAVEQRRAHGQTTIVEVAQARQASAQARLGAVQARGHEINLRIALLATMGISPLVPLKLIETRYRPLVPQDGRDAAAAVSQALSRRPDMLAALAARNAADQGIAAARADYRPKVFLSAGASYQTGHLDITALPGAGDTDRTDNLTGSSRSAHAIIGLSIPLYDGGTRSAHLAQARARADGAAARFDSVRDLAIQEIVLARTTVETEVAAFQAASELLTASKTSFDAALGAYRGGVGNLTEVNMAEIALMNARTTRSLAFSDALSAAATLALATGSVSAPERP